MRGLITAAVTRLKLLLAAKEGAGLVGHKGASVAADLDLNLRRPRKLFAKLFASALAATQLKVIALGDSLAASKMQQVLASLDRRFGGVNATGINTAGTWAGAGLATGGLDLVPSSTVSCVAEVGKYEYWPTGEVLRIDAGGSSAWVVGGVSPTFTDVKVYYVKEPGAGTINLDVGGATVATASADAAVGIGILSYTQASAQAPVVTTVTGFPVRVLLVHKLSTTASGVDLYSNMAIGSLSLSSAMSSVQGRALFQAVLADISPDFVSFEMDDNFGDGAASDAALNTLTAILDATCPNADKLFIGSTPRSAVDAGKIAARNKLKTMCGSKGESYLFFDSYYLLGSYADMTAIFGADDGTHPTASAQAYAAEILWNFLGLNGFNLGYVPRAVNDRGTASRFGRGTKFGAGAGREVTLDTDAAFGFDWWLSFPRAFTFKTETGTLVAQFSGNTAVFPHVLPINVDFNSAGNVRKMGTSTASGYEFTQFRKTDNPGGGYMHINTGMIRTNFTRAELLAINANAVLGAIAFCTDCTGGAQLVYAKGGGPTDWVTVDGKAAI